MEYKGTWNAATNTPTLVNGTGNQGDVYLCNVAGTVNFGAGPIAFVVGDQVIYSGSIWQRASGATGTVTSVGITESGDSLNITGSPITTSGTINIGFNGTNLQYVNGAGNLTTFPTLITSIGLTMPSAFSVANSPLTANGTIAVTGAGYASQYIRGDGTLADFPSSGGGGSSVSYYLNGGTSQGTIGGVTYYEMSKTADTGTGVDFPKTGDGFIVAFLTDANDPAQLNIPAGNWNYEIYASMSSNGGTPQMYAELYKYDGTTFTLISTSANEIIYDGTALNLYTFAMAVPATSLTLTDRLAVKLYSTNSGGKTTTIHTQNSHLCQIITTFSTGITALNGLTAQVQYFQTGTSGTDFNISSTTATHTFNIPSASATNRGLITTGTQTIAGSKTFNATLYGTDSEFSGSVLSPIFSVINGTKVVNLQSLATLNRDIYLPDASGTIALTSDLANYVDLTTAQTISGAKTFTAALVGATATFTNAGSGIGVGITLSGASGDGLKITHSAGRALNIASSGAGYGIIINNETASTSAPFTIQKQGSNVITMSDTGAANFTGQLTLGSTITNGSSTYTLPSATGTLALTSQLTSGTVTSVAALTIGTSGTDLSSTVATSTTTPVITLNVPTASAVNRGALSSADWTTFNNKQSALTNPVTGTGTTNYLPKFTGASAIGNSQIFDNGTSVGIGTITAFSSAKLQIKTTTNVNLGFQTGTLDATGFKLNAYNDAGIANIPLELNASILYFKISEANKMTLDASGNLGLGVTPNTWTLGKAIQIGALNGLNLFGGNGIAQIGNNVYYNGGYFYGANGIANLYTLDGGHIWSVAASGTAGAAITFTQAMTLNNSGNVLIGDTTSPTSSKLYVKGSTSESGLSIRSGGNGGTYLFRVTWANGTEGSTFLINDNERVLIGTTSDAGTHKLQVNGSILATGFFESSDSRLKTLIQDNYQTKGIASITPKLYTKNGKVELGYYAQDFVGILDSAVSKGSDDMLSLSYREVHTAKIYALEQRIKELENK
jgi:hypothetical protein